MHETMHNNLNNHSQNQNKEKLMTGKKIDNDMHPYISIYIP
jgi:hypothetical protein